MKTTEIIFCWKEGKKDHRKEIDREDFYEMFCGLARGFEKMGDNQISKKLIEIIPDVDKISINKDVNRMQEIPYIAYYINENMQLMKIMRRHDIIWRILEKHCVE